LDYLGNLQLYYHDWVDFGHMSLESTPVPLVVVCMPDKRKVLMKIDSDETRSFEGIFV
jgi:hypothetical protein